MFTLGEIFYAVNRDDRTSKLEEHRFKTLEVTSIAKKIINNITVYAIAINGADSNLSQFVDMAYYQDQRPMHSGVGKCSTRCSHNKFLACGTSRGEILDNLTIAVGLQVYVKKEFAKGELKDLITNQLKSEEENLAGLKSLIENMRETLKSLD